LATSLGRRDPSLAKAKLPRLRIQDPVSVIFDVSLFFILYQKKENPVI